MAKNSIRVHSQSEYVIEVNDAGETITFDLADTGLGSRLFKMLEQIDQLTERYKGLAQDMDAEPDAPSELPVPASGAITRRQVQAAVLIDEFYIEARVAMDTFFGAGACQKIFADRNYFDMFADLLEQLKPHFEKMGLNADGIKARTIGKYKPSKTSGKVLK